MPTEDKQEKKIISWKSKGATMILRIEQASVYSENLPEITAAIGELDFTDYTHLIIDLGSIDFFDSSAIGWLLGMVKRSRSNGLSVKVVVENSQLMKTFERTRIDTLVDISSSLAGALKNE